MGGNLAKIKLKRFFQKVLLFSISNRRTIFFYSPLNAVGSVILMVPIG